MIYGISELENCLGRAYCIFTISDSNLEPVVHLYVDNEKEYLTCRTLLTHRWARCPSFYMIYVNRDGQPVGIVYIDESFEAFLKYDLFTWSIREYGPRAHLVYIVTEPPLEYRFYCDVYRDCNFSVLAYYMDVFADRDWDWVSIIKVYPPAPYLADLKRVIEEGEPVEMDETVFYCVRFRSHYEAKRPKGKEDEEETTEVELSAVYCEEYRYHRLIEILREEQPVSCDDFMDAIDERVNFEDELVRAIRKLGSPDPVVEGLISALETEERGWVTRDCSQNPIVSYTKPDGTYYEYEWDGSTWKRVYKGREKR